MLDGGPGGSGRACARPANHAGRRARRKWPGVCPARGLRRLSEPSFSPGRSN